ncbi:MAG: hypothetical protein PWP31_284 [Clostridia bacterium]|nr:hypothetical protein [Clostridia bacterium]
MFGKMKFWAICGVLLVLAILFVTGATGNGQAQGDKTMDNSNINSEAVEFEKNKNNDLIEQNDEKNNEQNEKRKDEVDVEEKENNEITSNDKANKENTNAVNNDKNFVPPEEGYWLDVNITEQKLRIYLDGDLVKEWVVSTGVPNKPTPLGIFKIQNRGQWFFSEKYQQGAKWWVSFKDWGVYLFHSVPMDREKNMLPEEAAKLGNPASHGCVRLEVENAKWIYDNIPQGSPVYIHN